VPGTKQIGGAVVVVALVMVLLVVVDAVEVVDAVVVVGGVGDTHMSAPQLENVWLLSAHDDVWPLLQTGTRLTIVEHVVIGAVQEVVLVDGVKVGGDVGVTQISFPHVDQTPEVVAQAVV